MERVERLGVGFGAIAAAVIWRCFVVPPDMPDLFSLGGWFPAIKPIDVVTGPLGVLGVVVLAATPGLSPGRVGAGVLAVIASVLWPVLTLPRMSPVVMTLTATHGVHVHDVVALPLLIVGLGLLAPWRTPIVAQRQPALSAFVTVRP